LNAVEGNNRCLFSDPHTKHTNTLCGQNVEFVNVKLVVHIVKVFTPTDAQVFEKGVLKFALKQFQHVSV
jgi:hypothetical protein